MYLATMLQQKIARLASDFASQLIGVLTAAPLEELAELDRPSARSAPPAVRKIAKPMATKPVAAKKVRATKKSAITATTAPVGPSHEVKAAALAFVAERGSKGATAHQVDAYLTELGLPSAVDVVGVLSKAGAIRDAGFRRAAGKNATAPVYVATSP
jgi:hypothetical protein